MAFMITAECINCSACEYECPVRAISGGSTARPAFGTITFRNGPNAGTLKLQAKVESGVTGTVTFMAGCNGTIREVTP